MNNSEQDLPEVLYRLNQIGITLSKERDIDVLLERILEVTIDILHADGGTLYLLSPEYLLKFTIIQNKSLNIKMGGTSGIPIPFPDIPIIINDEPSHNTIAAYCANTKTSVNIHDVYTVEDFDFSVAKDFDAKTGYRTKSVLSIPLIDHNDIVLGVLQLINCLDKNNKVIEFNDLNKTIAESLSSQASIVLQKQLLINQLNELFEGLISLINTAIDEKSPYTGGHCLRVPELTLMLAEAANDETEGPLASFTMSEADRYELKIAGMLHDCGKITTPVHVVDKATKLETIFDRIKLIEFKFEIIRRDLKIACLETIVQDPSFKAQAEEELQAQYILLDENLVFLRACNIGGERMTPEDIAKVKEIRNTYWIDQYGEKQTLLTSEEIENLTIVAGTLTQAEREVINHHIVATIQLLEKLPWPQHLQHVTEYAGGHHERMDGKGYPKGLTRAQMSPQARIMGIADIFEALTASDRPYKKGMKLSQSLAIMQRMKDDQHIDADLFDVFIKQKVYLDYAKRYLNPEQTDID